MQVLVLVLDGKFLGRCSSSRLEMLTIRMGQKRRASLAKSKASKIQREVRIGFQIQILDEAGLAMGGKMPTGMFGVLRVGVGGRTADLNGMFNHREADIEMFGHLKNDN